MARPIMLSDELVQKYAEEFIRCLSKSKFADGKVSFVKNIEYEDSEKTKAIVLFSPIAYSKMLMLIQDFSSEVAWHGTVERDGQIFKITDILVYPQEVTGVTVNTDQDGYQQWMMQLSDEQANHLHMQAHSHVNMSTSPSSVDLEHQESILKMLGKNQFYIFMIWNKRFEHTIKIYDMAENILYEDKDIDVWVGDDCCDLDMFIKDAKTIVDTKKPVTVGAKTSGSKSNDKKSNSKKKEDILDYRDDMSDTYPGYRNRNGYITDYDDYIYGDRGYYR